MRNLDARGVFLLGWVRMPSAREPSLGRGIHPGLVPEALNCSLASVVSQGLITSRFGRQSRYSGQDEGLLERVIVPPASSCCSKNDLVVKAVNHDVTVTSWAGLLLRTSSNRVPIRPNLG